MEKSILLPHRTVDNTQRDRQEGLSSPPLPEAVAKVNRAYHRSLTVIPNGVKFELPNYSRPLYLERFRSNRNHTLLPSQIVDRPISSYFQLLKNMIETKLCYYYLSHDPEVRANRDHTLLPFPYKSAVRAYPYPHPPSATTSAEINRLLLNKCLNLNFGLTCFNLKLYFHSKCFNLACFV